MHTHTKYHKKISITDNKEIQTNTTTMSYAPTPAGTAIIKKTIEYKCFWGSKRVLGTVGENVELAQQLYNSMEVLKN